MNKRLVIEIISVVLAVLLAILVFYGWKIYYYKTLPKIEPTQEEAPQTLGEQISEEAITNPAETIPQTNPYEVKTNPFEEVKTNPFKDAYKNPFE